jgi:predicted TIM-barrel fold metal-dependent hydrolase
MGDSLDCRALNDRQFVVGEHMKAHEGAAGHISRRGFVITSSLAVLGLASQRDGRAQPPASAEPIIDIHQHVGYTGRADDALLAHQRALGATTTILLPAGRNVNTLSTHEGVANGLQAQCLGNEACRQLASAHPGELLFGANEVPDVEGATQEIEKYLKLGAIIVGEQKFGVECDSPAMQRIYELAQAHDVPVLMHWQFDMYNYGFERFHTMLAKYPKVNFIGHAQTWWANIDRNHTTERGLYPKGPVTPGGLTDRYLSDYSNMYGDLSAGSGLNALTRDEDFARNFLKRHQGKLLYGSDCTDVEGSGPRCQGGQTIAAVRRLAGRDIERKLLYGNAKELFRL